MSEHEMTGWAALFGIAPTMTEAQLLGTDEAGLHARIEALIGPDEVFPDWKNLPHLRRVTEQRNGYTVTTTMIEVRLIREALTPPASTDGKFREGECAPPAGCGCACHQPGGMAVKHFAPCCNPTDEDQR